jgi:site-specific recombinase XerD
VINVTYTYPAIFTPSLVDSRGTVYTVEIPDIPGCITEGDSISEDINLAAIEVYVRSTKAKTRTKRTLYISYLVRASITRLIKARSPGWDNSVPVFCTECGTELNRNRWANRMKKYSKQLGVNITPYSLRHCFALEFLRNSGNAFALQRMLGHTDMAMTKRYVALTNDDLKEQHEESSPLNSIIPKKQRIRNI